MARNEVKLYIIYWLWNVFMFLLHRLPEAMLTLCNTDYVTSSLHYSWCTVTRLHYSWCTVTRLL